MLLQLTAKLKTYHASVLHKTNKTFFRDNFWDFLPENPFKKNFSKQFYPVFSLYASVNLCKKIKNSMHQFVIELTKFILDCILFKNPSKRFFP